MDKNDDNFFIDQIVSGVGAAEERMKAADKAQENSLGWIKKVERYIRETGSFPAGLSYQQHERALTIKSGNAENHVLVVRASGPQIFLVKQSKDGEESEISSAIVDDGHDLSIFFKKLGEQLKYLHTGGNWV